MHYNPFGYRFFRGRPNGDRDVFIYSSQGQLVAKYRIAGNTLKLDFLPIYEGSRRIGIVEPEGVKWEYCPDIMLCPKEHPNITVFRMMFSVERYRYGLKASRKYELTDHLGNVRVMIADQRVPVSTNGTTVAYYKPLVKSIHDYYPFGWEKQLTTVNAYPFTYQGQLFDRELGWQYYRYRNYDPMVARFWQVEPLVDSFCEISVYVFNEGKVTYAVEIEGLESQEVNEEGVNVSEVAQASRSEMLIGGTVNVASGTLLFAGGTSLLIVAGTVACLPCAVAGGVILMAVGGTQAGVGMAQLADAGVNEKPKTNVSGNIVSYGGTEYAKKTNDVGLYRSMLYFDLGYSVITAFAGGAVGAMIKGAKGWSIITKGFKRGFGLDLKGRLGNTISAGMTWYSIGSTIASINKLKKAIVKVQTAKVKANFSNNLRRTLDRSDPSKNPHIFQTFYARKDKTFVNSHGIGNAKGNRQGIVLPKIVYPKLLPK